MNKWITLGVFAVAATGCADVTLYQGGTTSSSGGATGGSGSSGGGDGGGLPTIGQPCDPGAVVDLCSTAGLVCDASSMICRLPRLGELCDQGVGCAGTPATLGCYSASLSGITESVCLVPCTTADSSNCPYGTSCGDPDLPGFCSAEGTDCTPWATCSLGGGVLGDCVPNGTHTICFASGTKSEPYASCDPTTTNSARTELCAAGSVCLPTDLTLGGPSNGGFCYQLCGGGSLTCPPGASHCDQPNAHAYGICRPGSSCLLSSTPCPFGEGCIADDPDGLTGGCLPFTANAAGLGGGCSPPDSVPQTSSCALQYGACLPADGGYACTELCDLADGGEPYCVLPQICTPLEPTTQTDVIGACR